MGKIINIEIDIEELGKDLFDFYEEVEDYICETNLARDIRYRLEDCMSNEITAYLMTPAFRETVDGLYEYYKQYMEQYLAKNGLKIIDDDKD